MFFFLPNLSSKYYTFEPYQNCHQKCLKSDGPAETLDDREERTSTKSFQVKKLNITIIFCRLSQSMYWRWCNAWTSKALSRYPTQLKLMNFSGSGTLCVVSFESLMEFQMLDGWLDAAPERTEVGLQQTGKPASSRSKDDNLSRGGRAQHNRTDYLS